MTSRNDDTTRLISSSNDCVPVRLMLIVVGFVPVPRAVSVPIVTFSASNVMESLRSPSLSGSNFQTAIADPEFSGSTSNSDTMPTSNSVEKPVGKNMWTFFVRVKSPSSNVRKKAATSPPSGKTAATQR
jgi:hypothetical protein